jgi:GMP synthase-like glutamine amidotransferase
MIYFIQHGEDTPPGTAIEWCELKRKAFKIIYIDSGDELPKKITSDDFFLFCGAPLKPQNLQKTDWLQIEKIFLKNCINTNIPIIGFCFGAQLIAEALGANITELPTWEVGWWKINFNTHKILPQTRDLEVFLWHRYGFTLPDEATHLAFNSTWSNQGFIYKNLP